ncbi:unnamed protein product [Symbiodinium sp. CCMP2592]|nr:unnamed protein product [Symbiodinium sp. CCMP2592]
MVYCADGIRFFAGVPIKALQEHLFDTKSEHQGSFHGACAALPEMSPISVFELGGFVTTLQANQVLEIPPGYLCAEALLTDTSTIVHWTTLRPIQQDLQEFGVQVDVARTIIEHDKANLPADKRPTLDVCAAQVQGAAIVRLWAEQKSRALEDCLEGPGLRNLVTLWAVKKWIADSDGHRTVEQFARHLAGLIAQNRVLVPWTEVLAAAGIEDNSEPSRMLLSALRPSVSSQMQMDVPDSLNIIRSLLPTPQTAARGQSATAAHPAAPTLKHTSKPRVREEGENTESAQAGPSQKKRKQKPEPAHSQEVNPPHDPSSQTQAPQPTETTAPAVSPEADHAAAATPATSAIDHASQAHAAAAASADTVVSSPLPKPSVPQAGTPPTPVTPQERSEAEIALAEMRKRLAATGGHRFQEATEDIENARKRQKLGSPKSPTAPTQPPQGSRGLPSGILDDDHEDETADLTAAIAKPSEGTGGGGGEKVGPSESSSGEDEDSDDDDDEKTDSYENGDSPDRDAVLASAL